MWYNDRVNEKRLIEQMRRDGQAAEKQTPAAGIKGIVFLFILEDQHLLKWMVGKRLAHRTNRGWMLHLHAKSDDYRRALMYAQAVAKVLRPIAGRMKVEGYVEQHGKYQRKLNHEF